MEQNEIKNFITLLERECDKKFNREQNRFDDCKKLIIANAKDENLTLAVATFFNKKLKNEAVLDEDRAFFAVFAACFGGFDGFSVNWQDAAEVAVSNDIFSNEQVLTQILNGSTKSNSVSSKTLSLLVKKMKDLEFFDALMEFAPRSIYPLDELIDDIIGQIGPKTKLGEKEICKIKSVVDEVLISEQSDALTRLKNQMFATQNSFVIKELIGTPGIDNLEVVAHLTSLDVLETVANTNYNMGPDERREFHNAIFDQMLEVRNPQDKNFEDCLVYCAYADPEKFAGLITTPTNAQKVVGFILEGELDNQIKLDLILPYGEIIAKSGNENQNISFILAYFKVAEKIDITQILHNILKIHDAESAIRVFAMLLEDGKISADTENESELLAINSLAAVVIENGSEQQNYKMALLDGRFIEHAKKIKNIDLLIKLAKFAQNKGDDRAAEFLFELIQELKERNLSAFSAKSREK